MILYVFPMLCSVLASFKVRTWLLWLLIGVSLFFQAATYQHQWWGLYHYQIGSKYFNELGYFDLYDCSALARGMTAMPRRDLLNYEFRSDFPECESLFSPERWAAFTEDLTGEDVFSANMLLDKGLNATPTWIALGELLSDLPMELLIWLDPLALVVALVIAGWLLDWRKVAYAALFILSFYGTIGRLTGHFGQWWWLALVIVGVALLEKRKDVGGLLLGLSATLAIFPAFLLIGRSKRILAWSLVGLLVGGAVGLFTSRGLSAYPEFIQNMMIHSPHIRYEPFNIGLFNTLSMAASPPETMNDWLTCFRGGRCAVDYQFESPWLLWLLLLPLTMRTRLGAMFGAITLSRYYYQIVAIVPLGEPDYRTRALFALNAVFIAWLLTNRMQAYQFGHFLWLAYFMTYWFVTGHKPVQYIQRVLRREVSHETQEQAHA
jgi:hypothetical protein